MEYQNEWLTTQQAADALGCSPRHLRNLIHSGQIWAKRDGKNWLVHSSLKQNPQHQDNPTESQGNSNGLPMESTMHHDRLFETFEEQINFLKEQLGEKDKQIGNLTAQNEKLLTLMAMETSEKKAIAETAQTLEVEIAQSQRPWWRRIFNRQHEPAGI